MADYITLLGAEQVQSAARQISDAADRMRNAGGSCDEAARSMQSAADDIGQHFREHQAFLTGWLSALELVLKESDRR